MSERTRAISGSNWCFHKCNFVVNTGCSLLYTQHNQVNGMIETWPSSDSCDIYIMGTYHVPDHFLCVRSSFCRHCTYFTSVWEENKTTSNSNDQYLHPTCSSIVHYLAISTSNAGDGSRQRYLLLESRLAPWLMSVVLPYLCNHMHLIDMYVFVEISNDCSRYGDCKQWLVPCESDITILPCIQVVPAQALQELSAELI